MEGEQKWFNSFKHVVVLIFVLTLEYLYFALGNHTHTCTHGGRLNIKTVFPKYGDSHVKDKTAGRPSYL